MTNPRKRSAARRAVKPDTLPIIPAGSSPLPSDEIGPPRRPTRARLQTYFLRRLALSGSVVDSAARAGVTPRTVQRWRIANAAFARRYEEVLAQRLEVLEDLAMRRALAADYRPVFHRGKQIASVERHNDMMLMRLLARFDRLRERQARQAAASPDLQDGYVDDIALLEAAGERARQLARRRAYECRARRDQGDRRSDAPALFAERDQGVAR